MPYTVRRASLDPGGVGRNDCTRSVIRHSMGNNKGNNDLLTIYITLGFI